MNSADPLKWAIATACGAGCLRPAPGTWGSLAAALAILPVLFWVPPTYLAITLLALSLIASMAGLWVCDWAIAHYQRGDPSQVVIDEVAGLWLTLALVVIIDESLMQLQPILTMLIAFAAFRCFDAWKPWPISRLEQFPKGWGIMLDDLGAAIPAALCVLLVFVALGSQGS